MFNLNALNNIKNPELIKEEIIKSKIEDNYHVQLTDYIILQKKVNSIKNLLAHKPALSALDYTKLNTFFNFSKSIIMPKKTNQKDNFDFSTYKSMDKKRINNKFDRQLYLSNPILKKIFLKKDEDDIKMSSLNTEYNMPNKTYQSAFHKFGTLNLKKNYKTNKRSNFIYKRPKDDLYKLPQQIKNKYLYNLTDLKKNSIKRNYEIKEKISKFDKFVKYYMRGLSLSEEQSGLYQKCKNADFLLSEGKKKKTKYVNMNFLNNKIDKRFSAEVIKKRLNSAKKEKNINGALFKYSLKNLLKAQNPIKILL